FRGLVNAVLRRIGREGRDWLGGLDAGRIGLPDWMWQEWVADWGEERAHKLALASLQEAPLDLTVKADPTIWAEKLGAEILPTGTLRLVKPGAIPALPGFEEGAWWVQDAAAALPARLMGDVAGLRIADLCAAPGGKTAQLALAGAKVTAVEKAGTKIARMKENLDRLGLTAEIVCADALSWKPKELFDGVLLDAPCSATGTIRRHPDALHLKRESDSKVMSESQQRLLASAGHLLKPGGRLVYCVCSLARAEGESVAAAGAPGLVADPIHPNEIKGLPEGAVTPEGWLRTFPDFWEDKGGMDGFFAARFLKI
ncbi:MAG: RsmB/NOP family class I SAM-dependent RNA methyltransferase, partial [Rhodospirillales bacterium]